MNSLNFILLKISYSSLIIAQRVVCPEVNMVTNIQHQPSHLIDLSFCQTQLFMNKLV